MQYRDFVAMNAASGTNPHSKEYVIGGFQSPTSVSIYPPNMTYPAVRANIKIFELPELMKKIKSKSIHICNPEVLAGYDFMKIPN